MHPTAQKWVSRSFLTNRNQNSLKKWLIPALRRHTIRALDTLIWQKARKLSKIYKVVYGHRLKIAVKHLWKLYVKEQHRNWLKNSESRKFHDSAIIIKEEKAKGEWEKLAHHHLKWLSNQLLTFKTIKGKN